MYDNLEKLGNSQIQHGKKNNRIYLMHLAKQDMPNILEELDTLAASYAYSKIFAKVPQTFLNEFLCNGYIEEAKIPDFYKATEDCIFMAKYLDDKRSIPVDKALNQKVLDVAFSKQPSPHMELQPENQILHLPNGFVFRKTEVSDVSQMAKVYSQVFNSYPFPISDPEYIKKTMNDNVVYFAIWHENEIVALSSCEMSLEDKNVEMTDFAILPKYRSHGFSYYLLRQMEKEMRNKKIKTAYTIARSTSFGMNSTFAKCDYNFGGVLVQNTQIGGGIEDMNVWFKFL